MKNIFKSNLIIISLVATFLIICCSKKDDDKNPTKPQSSSIFGTWDLTGITSEFEGQTNTVPSEEIKKDPLRYIFNDDNTGIQYYKNKETSFQWSISGNILTMTDSNQTRSYTFSINSITLTLTFKGGAYTITYFFTRE